MHITLFAVPCLYGHTLCQKFFVCPKLPKTWGYLGQPYFYKNIEKYNQVVIKMSIDMSKLYYIEIFEINKEIAAALSYPNMG